MMHWLGVFSVAPAIAMGLPEPVSEVPVRCTLEVRIGKPVIVLRNMGRDKVAVTTYRWAYDLHGWDEKGNLITDQKAFMARAELPSIQARDWAVLAHGQELYFKVDFYGPNGLVTGKVERGSVAIQTTKHYGSKSYDTYSWCPPRRIVAQEGGARGALDSEAHGHAANALKDRGTVCSLRPPYRMSASAKRWR